MSLYKKLTEKGTLLDGSLNGGRPKAALKDPSTLPINDTFRVGECILEATKQRDPCVKLGVRFNDINIVKQFWNTTMCGVYFKVIQTGKVTTGDTFELIKKCPENPTISDLYIAKRLRKGM